MQASEQQHAREGSALHCAYASRARVARGDAGLEEPGAMRSGYAALARGCQYYREFVALLVGAISEDVSARYRRA